MYNDALIVDQFIDSHIQEGLIFRDIRKSTPEFGLPEIEVSHQQARFLALLIQLTGSKHILEIGTLAGYSTLAMAFAAGPDGTTTTIEFEPSHLAVARDNIEYAGMTGRVEFLLGPALDHLSILDREISREARPFFDFVFIDADKENNLAYFNMAVTKLVKPGGVVIADNVIRDGRVLDPNRPDKAEFIRRVGGNRFAESCVIQTVGAKGWDGFVLARVL